MAIPSLTQPTFLGDRDPMIRDPFNTQPIEPGYIRDSDLGSAFVRYPAAGGRLIEKGIGALMDDPLGLVTGALSGVVDQARESGDPLSFLQDSAVALGLPIVESGQRLAGGDYGGMSLEEEEEARILDALTVAELIPMLGLGIKGVTGAMRRRLRAENPDMDDAEIEAIMAQMEGPGDPGGVDFGPRSELSLEEFEAGNVPMAGEIAGDMERFAPGFTRMFAESLSNVGLSSDEIFDRVNTALVERGYNLDERRQLLTDVFPDQEDRLAGLTDLPIDPIEIEMINASRVEDGLPPLPGEQIIAQEYDEIFNADTTAFPDDVGVPPEIGGIQSLEQRLDEQLARYFSGEDAVIYPFEEMERIGLDLQGLGYSDADIADAFDNALSRYTPEQRRQFRTDAAAFGEAQEYDPVIAGDDDGFPMPDLESEIEDRLNYQLGRYFGDNDMMTISDSLVGIGEDVVAELDNLGYGAAETFNFIDEAMERGGYNPAQRRQLMDELFPPVATEPGQPLDPFRDVADADDIEPLQIPEGGAPPGLQALANAVQENMANDPLDPFGPPPGAGPTPMNQLEAMDFSMTGQDTALNSRLDEVLAQGGQTKFANLEQLRNYLMNPKNRVSNAELEARGITEANFGNSKIDLNNPDTQELLSRTPLKVRILDGADVQYKGYFLNNPTDYRETVITLGNTPFDGPQSGVGDSGHFAATQYSMKGPTLVHMRTGQFDVIDPPTENKGATIAGKTFHVGEIQSEATQDATRVRKSRRFMEAVGGGDFNVGDQRLQTPFLQIARLKAQKRLEEDRVALQNAGQRFSSSDLAKLNEARKGFNYRDDGGAGIDAEIKAILETNGLPETFYEDTLKGMVNSKLFEEDVNAFLNDLIEGEGNLNSPGEVANRLGYFGDEVSRIALQTSPDDVGLGSLYQTDRITNIAVKQALEQAINSGADFITFNRSDLVQGMTGGDLKGHQEYYDKILPKNVNKLMERLEKEHKVKLPRLEDLKIRSSGPELGKVKGFALTPELKELFKGTGISAYREGGQVKLRSGVMALPGNGVVR